MTMELKDALDLVLNTASDTANMFADGGLDAAHDEIKHAIRLLRDGSEKVEHAKRDMVSWWCNECKVPLHSKNCKCKKKDCRPWVNVMRHYTTHNELKIIEVTSDPVFVEIGDEG